MKPRQTETTLPETRQGASQKWEFWGKSATQSVGISINSKPFSGLELHWHFLCIIIMATQQWEIFFKNGREKKTVCHCLFTYVVDELPIFVRLENFQICQFLKSVDEIIQVNEMIQFW